MGNIKRIRRIVHFSFDKAVSVHLQIGDCLLAGRIGRACGCGLRDEEGELRVETAEFQWRTHKREVIADWGKPFPCFGAAIFDQAKLPEQPDPKWSPEATRWWEIICAEVEQARGG